MTFQCVYWSYGKKKKIHPLVSPKPEKILPFKTESTSLTPEWLSRKWKVALYVFTCKCHRWTWTKYWKHQVTLCFIKLSFCSRYKKGLLSHGKLRKIIFLDNIKFLQEKVKLSKKDRISSFIYICYYYTQCSYLPIVSLCPNICPIFSATVS